MKKILSTLFIAFVIFGIFFPVHFASAQLPECSEVTEGACLDGGKTCSKTITTLGIDVSCQEADGQTSSSMVNSINSTGVTDYLGWIMAPVAKGLSWILIKLSNLLLVVVGFFFDTVMKYTIIDMAKNVGDSNGIGGSISAAWGTLRDIANMTFIFVLLYAAFNAMFSLKSDGFGKTVANIIIVALLINFSLFFTKIVIDASNIVSVGFYNSITQANTTRLGTLVGGENIIQQDDSLNGISAGYMNLLGIATWNSPSALKSTTDAATMFTFAAMSSIFVLVTCVILLITALMFIARFVILIFLMILSPVALVAYIIPGQKKQFDTWKGELVNQALFAPIFFAMTWVVFKIASSPGFLGTNVSTAGMEFATLVQSPFSVMALVLNFVLVIAFAIIALVTSKQIAGKTAAQLTTSISGGMFGSLSRVGRETFGRGGNALMNSRGLRESAASGNKFARMGLWASGKAAAGSYDVRAIDTIKKMPNLGKEMDILGKPTGAKGFSKMVEDKSKSKADYAKKMYGGVGADKNFDKEMKETAEKEINKQKEAERNRIKTERRTERDAANIELKKSNEEIKKYEKEKLSSEFSILEDLKKQRKNKEAEINKARTDKLSDIEINKLVSQSKAIADSIEFANENLNEKKKDMEENDAEYAERKEKADEAKRDLDEKNKAMKEKIKDTEFSSDIQKKIKELQENIKNSGNKRQQAYANRLKSGVFGWWAGSQAAAAKIEAQSKEQTKDKKLADIVKEFAKDEEKENTEEKKSDKPEESADKKDDKKS